MSDDALVAVIETILLPYTVPTNKILAAIAAVRRHDELRERASQHTEPTAPATVGTNERTEE